MSKFEDLADTIQDGHAEPESKLTFEQMQAYVDNKLGEQDKINQKLQDENNLLREELNIYDDQAQTESKFTFEQMQAYIDPKLEKINNNKAKRNLEVAEAVFDK